MWSLRRARLEREAKKGVKALLTTNVRDIMTDYVVTIAPEKSVTEAAAIMIGEDVSSIVVEKEGKPLGILTERDFITKVPLSKKVFSLKVGDIMSSRGKEKVTSVTEEQSVADARKVMAEKHIRKLVVQNDEGFIAGIITQTDLSRTIYEKVKVLPRVNKPLLVKEVMNSHFLSVEKKEGFAKAKTLMKKKNVSSLPVTEKGEVVGIFTEYDVVAQFYDLGGKLDIKELHKVMKTPVKTIPATTNIFDANTIMLFEKVRRLLVMENNKVVGFLTQTDLVHNCILYAEKVAEEYQEGIKFGEKEYIALHRKEAIISEYAGEHLRTYRMRE